MSAEITTTEAAALLGVTRQAVQHLRKAGRLSSRLVQRPDGSQVRLFLRSQVLTLKVKEARP
jgi:excisionase family DNA binding protein